jgi:hypothetical protein
MRVISYPFDDPRRKNAIIPHGSIVKIVGKTEHCVIVLWAGERFLVHEDFLA